MSVVNISEQPAITDALGQLLTKARKGEVTYVYVLAQVEQDDTVDWYIVEEGEVNPNPEHLISLIGHLTVATNRSVVDLDEVILDD